MNSVVVTFLACFGVLLLFFWVLFITRSVTIGKFLYKLNVRVESKKAKLLKQIVNIAGKPYVYLSNQQQNKPIMILLHGFSADKTIWLKFAKYATDDFNLVIPDLLGHGDIPYQSSENYSTPNQAKYLADLIYYIAQQNPSQPFIVIGNSMGGMICAQLLKSWDELNLTNIHLKQSVLIDPAGAVSDLAKQIHSNKQNPFVHNNIDSVMDFYKLAMQSPPFIPPSVKHYLAHKQYLDRAKEFTHMFSDFFDTATFFDQAFAHDSKPALVIWGEQDGLLPVSDAQKWQSILNVDPVILKGIGHMPMVECPKVCFEIIVESLNKI